MATFLVRLLIVIGTSVVIVDEHDEVKHGTVLVQSMQPDKYLQLADSTGRMHTIRRVVVLTEQTLDAILDTLRNKDIGTQIKKILPATVPQIVVVGR